MFHYILPPGPIPSFGHTPIWIQYRRETYSTTRARSHRARPTTPRRMSGRVIGSGPVTPTPCKKAGPRTLRRILGVSRLSKMRKLSSRSTRACHVHSTMPRSSIAEPCFNTPTLALSIRKREAQALVDKTRVLESSIPLSRVTCSPESDDNDEPPPQYATLDPYPLSDTEPGHRNQSAACTPDAKRTKGLRYMSKKMSKNMFNAIRNVSAAARSSYVK